MLPMDCFIRRRMLASTVTVAKCIVSGSVIVFALTGCAAPFSEMHGARLAGVHRTEVTPTFSTVSAPDGNGGTEGVQMQFGLHAAYGVSQKLDLRLRYERISPNDQFGNDAGGTNVLAIGPKLAIKRDMVAVYVPVGFAFGGGIES